MESKSRPEVVREKVTRVSAGRVACALIFDRELEREEIRRFYAEKADATPRPVDFDLAGRVLRYECLEDDEARWRLAAEILLVKSFREAPKRRTTDNDARVKRGMRPLHR